MGQGGAGYHEWTEEEELVRETVSSYEGLNPYKLTTRFADEF
jgi:hypothetical protein